jgi:hypothetical protein
MHSCAASLSIESYRLSRRESDTKSEALSSTVALWLMEPFDKNASVHLDNAAGRHIVGICSHLDMGESFCSRVRKQQSERLRRVASPTFPWHHRVPNMSQAVRRQLGRANLPPEPDRTTEFTIPHPHVVTRQPWNRRTVWERNRGPLRFPIDLLGKETFGILLDSR